MNFSMDIVKSTNDDGMDAYNNFYKPFQEVLKILAEK